MVTVFASLSEAELQADIVRLGHQIDANRKRTGHSASCAVAYLTQVLRDRRNSLASLRVSKQNPVMNR